MYLWEINHPGHYIGSTTIVLAPTETIALELAKAELVQSGLDIKKITSVKMICDDFTKQQVVHFTNGDY